MAAEPCGVRVMIVDDRADMRRALSRVIEAEPSFELVGTAEDFETGLNLARRELPDVAIVDYSMPGGGPALVQELRARFPQTQIVALSAFADRAAVFAMLRAGAASYVVKGEDVDELVRTVRRAAAGQSTLSPSVAPDVLQELTHRLRDAEQEDDARRASLARIRAAISTPGAIEIAYQPAVRLSDRQTIGFEALARFRMEPPRGPDAWFAEARSVGLELELERAALRAALEGLKRLPFETWLSVNLGPAAILDDTVLELLADGVPRRTIVEITEHVLIDDYDQLRHALLGLRARGLRIAADDAGAGYASLRHVLRLLPDVIKIDASLMGQLATDRAARAITSAMLAMAEEMRQIAILEGVEDEETVQILLGLGAEFGQGYLFGSPQPLGAELESP
jgi:EAL domain-containing protein (putative c-di-GMP-specific phosphodiesterase class I)/CheY-like chemotaxis protein